MEVDVQLEDAKSVKIGDYVMVNGSTMYIARIYRVTPDGPWILACTGARPDTWAPEFRARL